MVDELTHVHGETREHHPVDHGDRKQGPGPSRRLLPSRASPPSSRELLMKARSANCRRCRSVGPAAVTTARSSLASCAAVSAVTAVSAPVNSSSALNIGLVATASKRACLQRCQSRSGCFSSRTATLSPATASHDV